MGHLGPTATLETVLTQEIVITQEVRKAALAWRQSGALIFGLSDKPDEASIPTAAAAADGNLPLHRVRMKVVGALY